MRQSNPCNSDNYVDIRVKMLRNGWGGYKQLWQNATIKRDCQLKEQFIHGLNDKTVLDKVFRELTTKSSSDQMTSEDVLIWAKRVEAQRMQAAILSNITDSWRFDQVKVVKQQAAQSNT